ncbi:Iron(3+)-hydroxamate-binding protein YxeB precursor [compost metagenome]
MYTGHHFGHTLYKGIGYAVPENIRRLIEQSPGKKWKRISPEQLAGYAGDRVFLAMHSTGPDAAEAHELLNSPHWRRLPAVQAGRSHCMDLALANYNPLTLDAHLEAVGEQLLGKRSSQLLQASRL